MNEIAFDVDGYPPAKNEAISMLGASHPHRGRVAALLEEARKAVEKRPFSLWDSNEALGLELIVRIAGSDPWDATNYLGGIGDVLEVKDRRGVAADHLGDLRGVALYGNDRQIRLVRYREAPDEKPWYRVHLWDLDPYGPTTTEDFRGRLVAHLTAIRAKKVLLDAAELGYIAEVECEMPRCYCPDGRGYFEPRTHPVEPWNPSPDHFPDLNRDGGKFTPENVRLSHDWCNKLDFGVRTAKNPAKAHAAQRLMQAQKIVENAQRRQA